jgi:hypothetical protein
MCVQVRSIVISMHRMARSGSQRPAAGITNGSSLPRIAQMRSPTSSPGLSDEGSGVTESYILFRLTLTTITVEGNEVAIKLSGSLQRSLGTRDYNTWV